ncbi:MAG: DNA-directed RNA polymerase subunit A' [Thermoplasmata archaeon]
MQRFGVSKRIGNIKFAILSPDEIRRMSAVKVISADTYDDDGYPIDRGLMDTRMGVIEPGLRCKTCNGRVDECPGHFGHIDLAMPVIHIGYVKEIKKFLQHTCSICGRILLSEDEIRMVKELKAKHEAFGERVDFVSLLRELKIEPRQICPYCKTEQKKITLDKPTTFRENGVKITPKDIRDRLERIPNEDLEILGINPETARPEWLVLTALPVPPVTVRPSITLESGDRSEDDLTHKLVDVLRINQRLRENRDIGAPQLIVEDLWELLQYHVTTYFDNQTSGIPPARHRSGRPLKTLVQRLKGKEGRFRSNLSGKRVNFSARTVISPDPNLGITEVGVPEEAARELTVPLYVTSFNVEVAKEFVKRGPNPENVDGKYVPGANYVISPEGRRIKITEKNKANVVEQIGPGWIVERQLMDGDICLFNRQPSLHRMSMLCHEVRVMPHKTFRFNLCLCPPYNADFDGDEMNLHVLQSEEARAEAKILMRTHEHILSPRFGAPIIGPIHDHITGSFLLTYKNPTFTREEVNFIFVRMPETPIPPPDGKKDGKEIWYGKSLFSIVLPPDLNLTFRASICQKCDECKKENCEIDAYVKIKDGKLLCGAIDGKGIAVGKGKILDKIARDYGSLAAKEFLEKATRLAIGVITLRGFTTGISDEDIPEEAKNEIRKVLENGKKEVNELVNRYRNGTLELLPGRSLEETLEVEVMRVLGKARDEAGKIAGRYLGIGNSAVLMAKSGARGNMLNLTQMCAALGQQAVRGERLFRGYYMRTLPHFKKGDLGAEARGFVESSYKSGLKPTEYFFHSMGGREALVDTAVRTSRSGYMQRRLINALEDLRVMEDRTVRNTAGMIIQFRYGEDGIDPARSVQGNAIDAVDLLLAVLGGKEKKELEETGEIESGTLNYGEVERDILFVEEELEVEEEEIEEEYEEYEEEGEREGE